MEKLYLKRLPLNTVGRTLIVGDIHGHFTLLQQALDAVEFDPTVDVLVCTGDLIDRGPESLDVVKWLNYPWFHSVAGNHDAYAIRYEKQDIYTWCAYGGLWFQELDDLTKANVAALLDTLPAVIEIETSQGIVGVLHGDPIVSNWTRLQWILTSEHSTHAARKDLVRSIQNSRRRYDFEEIDPVEGVRAVVVGHQPIHCVVRLGNVHYIDTRGWVPVDGHFTLYNAETLTVERKK